MPKKGEATATGLLIAAIIVIIGGFLVLKLEASVPPKIEDYASREICKKSVLLHSKAQVKNFDAPSSLIDCPTLMMEIKGDRITYQYEGEKGKPAEEKLPTGEKKETAIKKAIADEIYRCWNQFGEGKLDLFGGPKKYCSVCTVMTFSETKEIDGFNEYLLTNTVPNDALAKEGVTYIDYMNSHSKTGRIDRAQALGNREIEEAKIDTTKPQAAVFVYAKSEPFLDNAQEFLGKFWRSSGGKVAVAGGVLIVGGLALSATGVGLPAGVALIGGGLLKAVTEGALFDGIIEAYATSERIKDWSALVVFGEYNEDFLKGMGCQELPLSKK